MLGVIIGAMMTIAGFAQNPFETQATNEYQGVFVSQEFKLRLYEKDGGLAGKLFWSENIYDISANIRKSVLVGNFSKNSEQFPFSLKNSGGSYCFKAGNKTATMKKIPKINFVDTWIGDKVKVILEKSTGNQYKGLIYFNGQKFMFNGNSSGIGLTGTFSNGSNSYPVSLAQDFEQGKLEFTTGTFSEVLKFGKPCEGTDWVIPDMGMEFVYVENGTFKMGSNNKKDEQPIHSVTISNNFWIGKYEVTNGEFIKFLKETGKTSGVNFSGKYSPINKSYNLTNNYLVAS